MQFPYTVNKRQNIQVNRITNSFLYSFLLHILLRDSKTLEVVKMNTILHSHEVWLSQSAHLPHSAENILGQGELWGGCIIDKCAADTVTQRPQQAGSNGERRGAVTSLVRKRGPLKDHPDLQKQFSCDTVHSLVSSCNTWETHHPKAMP